MIAVGKPITRREFMRCVNIVGSPIGEGYDTPARALMAAMGDDHGSGCYRSTFDGEPYYFLQTKGFEFVWLGNGLSESDERLPLTWIGHCPDDDEDDDEERYNGGSCHMEKWL